MRSVRTFCAIILVALFASITACCASATPKSYYPAGLRTSATAPRVALRRKIAIRYPYYDTLIRLEQCSTGYTHLVQEIEMQGGYTLVECFRVSKGRYVLDHHSGYGWRRMRVYPAVVVGALEPQGFAHLMRNQDGSMRTNIPDGFNAHYRKLAGNGPWPGMILRMANESVTTWRITPDDDLRLVELWTPEELVFLK